MSELSPFHQEILFLLQINAKTRAEEEGFDPEHDPELQKFNDAIDRASASSLNDILEDYQHIFSERGPIHIERRWMSAFSEKEFTDVGLARYFPKVYRGLPRYYHRDDPSKSRIKKNFTNLARLKMLSTDRAIFSLYEGKASEKKAKIGLLTHVMTDGLGDWVAVQETASILRAKWPSLDIQLFVSTSRELPETDFPVHTMASDQLNQMDFILQIPTLVPDLGEIKPRIEKIGEYGFLESGWYHPKSGNRSLGLHVLEKGIFIRKPREFSFAQIEQKSLLCSLFGTETPGPLEIDVYNQNKRFHLAYLATPTGGAIYFHSLLKMWERDARGIDLCCPDLRWFIQWLEEEKEPVLAKSLGVKEIQIEFNEEIHRIACGEKGKTVRLINPGPLSLSDMRKLISLSGDWVAVRGNQSLSEAISAKKAFFYDGRDHARYFFKDLLAFAENRLNGHRSALNAFRLMGQAFLYNVPDDPAEWVEETHFQKEQLPPWHEIANDLGLCLQDPDAIAGFKKFCRLISEEHSFTPFLCHLVERELFHAEHPAIRGAEEQLVQLYATDQISFSTLVKNLKVRIVRK